LNFASSFLVGITMAVLIQIWWGEKRPVLFL